MCPIYTGNFEKMIKTKPPSQKEIIYYRERKICLVCKGKVIGFNTFICPSCDALYCENCARALTLLENACWVCKGPIDSAKQVKPFEKDDYRQSVKSPKKT
jgi:hypothetical protein